MFDEEGPSALAFIDAIHRYIPLAQWTSIALTSVVIPYLLWRLWAFTVQPILEPDEPPEYPYLIPYVGHAAGFFLNLGALLTRARHYYGNTRKPFIMTVAGQKLYIITSPMDMNEAYKNTTLSITDYMKNLHTLFEMSPEGKKKMKELPAEEDLKPGQQRRNLMESSFDLHHAQLLPGPLLNSMWEILANDFENLLTYNKIPTKCIISSTAGQKVVSLNDWVKDTVVRASINAFFGPKLIEIAPDIVETLMTFDDLSHKIMFKYPAMFAQDLYAARRRITVAMTEYFALPVEDRPGACYYILSQEQELRDANMNTRDIAIINQMFQWAANANGPKMTFWMLSYLLYHPSVLATIKPELEPMIQPNGSIDIDSLANLTKAPRLDALWKEVLFHSVSTSSIRNVTEPITLGGFKYLPGRVIIMPYAQLHDSPETYGPTLHEFDPERFLKNKKLEKSGFYRPFGGGTTYCSGRFIAQREVYGFISLLFSRFEVRLADGSEVEGKRLGFPRYDKARPSAGVMYPLNRDDVFLAVKPKKN